MGINLIELMSKWNQFQNLLKQCNKNPEQLLQDELQKRNINPAQLQDLITQAKQLSNLIGHK